MIAGAKPWRAFGPVEPGRSYVALVTELRLTRWTALPSFGRHTAGSLRQLARTPGVLGYALRAAPHRRTFWTASVWEDEAAMAAYVRAQPHRDAMRWLRASGAGTFRSSRWRVADAEVPLRWDAALARLTSD